MTLTTKERRAVLRAAELVAKNATLASCYALAEAIQWGNMELVEQYAEFYGFDCGEMWPGLRYGFSACKSSSTRVLLLLWFAEVCS